MQIKFYLDLGGHWMDQMSSTIQELQANICVEDQGQFLDERLKGQYPD